jgi:3',5'-cyclic AMP phosphodiesterase CpdA
MNQENIFRPEESSKPYTHLNFKNNPDEFQFAIITDNAGGARPGVFPKAVEMVNLLQPEFVVNAGDLIEGYSDDEDEVRAMWQEVDEHLEQLEMPFFFVPGNHDLNYDASIKLWRERFGGDRGYYHFVYKDVLFLMVNTEDPPKTVADLQRNSPELLQRITDNYEAMEKLQAKEHPTSEDSSKLMELAEPVEEWLGEINISDDQVAYFKQVLARAALFFAYNRREGSRQLPQDRGPAGRPPVHSLFCAHTHLRLPRAQWPGLYYDGHQRRYKFAETRRDGPCGLGHHDQGRPQDRQPADERHPRQKGPPQG